MQKIPFKKFPDISTPVNDSNMNLLQNNVENEFYSFFKIRYLSQSVAIGANAMATTVMGALPAINGYTFIGILPKDGGVGDQFLISYSLYGSNIVAMIHSKYSSTLSGTIKCALLYVKNDYINYITA